MQIGLFGGSFNPPHLAHLLLATYVLEATDTEEVWWVPTWSHAFEKALLPFQARVEMVEAQLAPYPRMKVNRVEERLGGVSYMFETITALRREHPGHRFRLLVGADVLEELPRWHRSAELLESVDVVAVGRTGSPVPSELAPRIQLLPVELPEISSSRIRAVLEGGGDVDGLLARSVRSYIERRRLYRP